MLVEDDRTGRSGVGEIETAGRGMKLLDDASSSDDDDNNHWVFPLAHPILLRRHVTTARGDDVPPEFMDDEGVPEGAVVSYECQWVADVRRIPVMELLQQYPALVHDLTAFDIEQH